MTSVHSSQLQFTRDGRTLVVAEHDGVRLVERAGPDRRWIAISEVQSIAAFTDQVWVATCKGMLQRLGVDGRQLDEHPLPVDPDAALYPTTIGAPSALWTACDSVMLFEDMDRFACTAAQVGAAIPIAGRRLAHYAGPRLTLPAGTAMTLANGGQIAGGCVILEGTSLALVAEHPHGRSIVVVALASGRALQSVAVPQGKVRIAARRGVAVVQDAARHLVVVDLKFGRQVGAMVTVDDVTDVAIDPDGQLLALRLASGELEFAPLGQRRGGATQLSVAQAASAAAAVEAAAVPAAVEVADRPPPAEVADRPPPAPDDALPAESSTSAPRPVEGLISVLVEALEPRPPRARLSRAQAQVELDRRDRAQPRHDLRRGPGWSGDSLVRRGRLAVCQADRGPIEQRPLRQSRGQLPAAADRCVRGHRDADHQQRRLDRSGVQAPAVVSAVVPVSRRGDPGRAVARPPAALAAARREARVR